MIRYVKKRWTAPLYRRGDGDRVKIDLLWGDRVRVLDQGPARWHVKARGQTGYVTPSHLGTRSYLELYFIDVGQGDGVLIRTPDDRHILIDGGWPRRNQPTGTNAADFVDWKFVKDYESDAIHLDALICSHNDQDHYGGLWDLLDDGHQQGLDAARVTVDAFYHAGLSWWRRPGGDRWLGRSASTTRGAMWTQLLGDRASLDQALDPGTSSALAGEWATFLRRVREARTAAGAPTPIGRLSHAHGTLPGFDDPGGVSIRVMAPVEFTVDGGPAIRKFPNGDSKNTNGNSVLLRLDYGAASILLTGDLNHASQRAILEDYAGARAELEADVVKACHHGSDDVSLAFLEAIRPACTIISSGDSEGHDHPRPAIVAASGLTGHRTVRDDRLVTPLVYSTELARSVALGRVTGLDRLNAGGEVVEEIDGDSLSRYRTEYRVTLAGDRNPSTGRRRLADQRVAARTTYGLINVRTDGHTIMCAALNEKRYAWNVETFPARPKTRDAGP